VARRRSCGRGAATRGHEGNATHGPTPRRGLEGQPWLSTEQSLELRPSCAYGAVSRKGGGEVRFIPVRARAACGAFVVTFALTILPVSRADATWYNFTREKHKGFDTCGAPSTSQMDAWWSYSPYFTAEAYIGGNERGCPTGNLSTSWFTEVINKGWRLYLTWVGPQSACSQTGATHFISTNTFTAYTQGVSEADQAYVTATSYGFGGAEIIEYDLEAMSTGNISGCRDSAQAFMDAWDNEAHTLSPGFNGSIYGSSCGSYMNDFKSINHPPAVIRAADFDGNPNVYTLACVNSSAFNAGNQRSKQYVGQHNETQGGVQLFIDNNCADAYANPEGGATGDDPACTGS
jgi:hypothetical protein